MDRNVTYNFVVVNGNNANPTSSLDDLHGVMEFEDVSRGIAPTTGPLVVVKVVDKESKGEVPDFDGIQANAYSRVYLGSRSIRYSTQQDAARHGYPGQAKVLPTFPLRRDFHRLARSCLVLYWCRSTPVALSGLSAPLYSDGADTMPIHHGGNRILPN